MIQKDNRLEQKYNDLIQEIKKYQKAVVAFSGGVDSTFLLNTAKLYIGDNVLAIILKTGNMPQREYIEAIDFLEKEKILYEVCVFDESKIIGYKENPANRCYLCKKALFQKMKQVAKAKGISYILEGSNIDDMKDYRPGLAALQELEIKSPLRDAKLSKEEIRTLSKSQGLATWNKPAYSCLATRIPYGEIITKEKLEMIEQAENYLIELGFSQMRVRHHGVLARIEIEREEMKKFYDDKIQKKVYQYFKQLGFLYTALDLNGYQMGNMNQQLSPKKEIDE